MAKAALSISFKDSLTPGLKRYFDKVGMDKPHGADFIAKTKMGVSFINWIVNGSPRVGVVPPILTGNLRGSGSVFVGSVLVHTTRGDFGAGKPATSHNGKPEDIWVGFNTAYAAKLHETEWTPGLASERSGDVGNKFVQLHLQGDGKAAIELYARFLKTESGA